ncbi:hypothetical protein [Aquimarina sp. AU119]|nr:hypothetical protein [Aquimarina sp. AU119]
MKTHCRDCGWIGEDCNMNGVLCPICESEEVYYVEDSELKNQSNG